MARMTKEEIASLPSGYYVHSKCDRCSKPIFSSLTFRHNGEDLCSRVCYEAAQGLVANKPVAKHKENIVKKDKDLKKGKVAEKAEKPEKNKSDKPDKNKSKGKAVVEEVKKKKKPVDDDEDEEEAPKKKAKKAAAEEEAPKKKKKAADDEIEVSESNPFRPSSISARVFEMALKGTSWEAIKKLADDEGCGSARLIRDIKQCQAHDTEWKIKDLGNDSFKIIIKK
jgi:hypothetical protein